DLGGDANRIPDGHLALARDARAQRLALHEGHHVVQRILGLARVVTRQDVRMRETGRDANFAMETFAADSGREIGMQQLHRDAARVLGVLAEIDGRHAPATELALYLIAVAEG